MDIYQAYRYELDPTVKQCILFAKCAGTARFAYNWGLALEAASYRGMQFWKAMTALAPGLLDAPVNGGKYTFLSAYALTGRLTKIKREEFPWVTEVSNCIPEYAFGNVEHAFKHFFRKVKLGDKNPGFPKFKKKGKCRDSFTLRRSIYVFPRHIQFPRIGKIRTKESTHKFKGKIKSATISRQADRWFVSICVERERPDPKPIEGPVVGIDLGINQFAVCSDGLVLESPRALKNSLRRLQRLSKQHSRKENGSNNKKKSAMRLARLHRKIKNQRKDFLHKSTTSLTKTKSVIVIEDLAVSNMVRNKRLSREISDQGWREFRRQLHYKSQWYGSELVIVPRFYPSSKTCSNCGAVNDNLKLGDRIFGCTAYCGLVTDRDLNAALNLESLATSRVGTTRFQACGENGKAHECEPFMQQPSLYEAGIGQVSS